MISVFAYSCLLVLKRRGTKVVWLELLCVKLECERDEHSASPRLIASPSPPNEMHTFSKKRKLE